MNIVLLLDLLVKKKKKKKKEEEEETSKLVVMATTRARNLLRVYKKGYTSCYVVKLFYPPYFVFPVSPLTTCRLHSFSLSFPVCSFRLLPISDCSMQACSVVAATIINAVRMARCLESLTNVYVWYSKPGAIGVTS